MYLVPAKSSQADITVKKSRFIAIAEFVDSRDAAKRCIDTSRSLYPDASHHVWAYVIGAPESPVGVAMSDDGEPSGTAGRPILNVIQHKEIGDIVIVVIRYFGGIKLGAGGLVRAYCAAAQAVLDAASFVQHIDHTSVCLQITYAEEQYLRHWLTLRGGTIVNMRYAEDVFVDLNLPVNHEAALISQAGNRGWVMNK